jgi:hypothetical protein
MAGRPLKEYSIRRNGGSILVSNNGSLVGSISLRELCEIVRTRDLIRTDPISAQRNLKKQVLSLRRFRTTEAEPEERPDLKGKNSA